MYQGVLLLILGEAIAFRSWKMSAYAAFLWLMFHGFILLYEEPTLRRKFGAAYADFCRNVPRWGFRIPGYGNQSPVP